MACRKMQQGRKFGWICKNRSYIQPLDTPQFAVGNNSFVAKQATLHVCTLLMIMIHDNIPHGVVRQIFFKNPYPKKNSWNQMVNLVSQFFWKLYFPYSQKMENSVKLKIVFLIFWPTVICLLMPSCCQRKFIFSTEILTKHLK